MAFYLGCAVWSYGPWVGDFYPAKTPSREMLALYGERFQCVEGNTTFYATPSPETIRRWHQETPESFRFCLKFPQTVSHQRSLMPQLPEAKRFLEVISPLGDRLGPVFLQLPPHYHPGYFGDLAEFLQELQQWGLPCRVGVEVRHLQWFSAEHQERLDHLLRSLAMGRVILDTRPIYHCDDQPQAQSSRKKPNVPVQPTLTTDFTLVRFISHPSDRWNEVYFQEWLGRIQQWHHQGTTIYFFMHCPIEDYSPQRARQFYHRLAVQGIPLPPLPWDLVPPEPQQLDLFNQFGLG